MIITFIGHSEISKPDAVRSWLSTVLDEYIMQEELVFYLGGYGSFDRMAASVVQEKKQQNPAAQSILVLPYLNRSYDLTPYDSTVFPPLETVPPRYAVSRRNQWMVLQADLVIAYVIYGWGGAAVTLDYAQRKHKQILRYPELPHL